MFVLDMLETIEKEMLENAIVVAKTSTLVS